MDFMSSCNDVIDVLLKGKMAITFYIYMFPISVGNNMTVPVEGRQARILKGIACQVKVNKSCHLILYSLYILNFPQLLSHYPVKL